jgi:hypothetical protein
MRRSVLIRLAALSAAALAGGACGRPAAAPPRAELLVATADSTYWVTSGADGMALRGAPLLLAHAGGRFYELFVADDDRSFYDAVLVGQRLYRRDLITGDSAVVFADSVVPRLATGYAAAHPAEYPLAGDEEPSEEPALVASAEVAVVAVHGPYATYDYHADVERGGTGPRSAARHGVVDWRTGRPAPLATLFDAAAARAIVDEGRRRFEDARDSVSRSDDPRAAEARAALAAFRFDEHSFALTTVEGRPAVTFIVTGEGDDAGATLPLEPVVAPAVPAWWGDVRTALAEPAESDSVDRWRGRRYELRARYRDDVAALALVDGARREWPLGAVQPPLERVLWLDRPPLDAVTRRALQRAFDESALYDEGARLAARRGRRPAAAPRGAGRVLLASAPARRAGR